MWRALSFLGESLSCYLYLLSPKRGPSLRARSVVVQGTYVWQFTLVWVSQQAGTSGIAFVVCLLRKGVLLCDTVHSFIGTYHIGDYRWITAARDPMSRESTVPSQPYSATDKGLPHAAASVVKPPRPSHALSLLQVARCEPASDPHQAVRLPPVSRADGLRASTVHRNPRYYYQIVHCEKTSVGANGC